jgi:serine/threonine-protein kinase
VAVAYQHVSEWAPPVTSVNPNVPAALEAIVDRAMEKDPMGRYQTASEMRTDLLRFLRGEMPSAAAVIPVVAGADAATQLFTASSSPPPPPTATPDETARHVATLPEEPESRRSYVFGIIALLLLLAAGIFLLTRLLADSDDGPELIAVPSVANLTRDAAVDELQSLDFRVRIQDVASADIEQGFVIDTDPPAGTQVEIGSTVTLIVSLGPEQFPVPPVVGLAEDAARALIEEQEFVVGNVARRFDNTVAAGLVLEQNPDAGEPAAPGTEVDLVVSDGPFAFTVPDVSDMSRDDAIALLEEEGFEVEVEEEFDEEVEEDFVIRSEPGAGQLVDRENPVVTIFVSQGPEPFSVPDFIGDTVGEAQQRAAELGLELIISGDAVEVSLDSGLDGLVAEQEPAAGTEVTAADPVRVRLGAVRQVTVPDLEGLTEDEARDELEDVGLELDVVGTVPVDFGSGFDGRVVGQDPEEGETVPAGSVVGVQLGEEEPPPTTTTTTTTTTPTTTPP